MDLPRQGESTLEQLEIQLLQERNELLRESVELQRDGLTFQKEQAAASTRRIGEYANSLLKEGINSVLSDLRLAVKEDHPSTGIRVAIERLENILR